MTSSPDKLVKSHRALVQSDNRKVISHVQRAEGEWYINTLMIEGCEAPFRYRRKQPYKNLAGARVNLTYYPERETVGGFPLEVMKVVRLRRS
jgi:hypothetical protein